MVYSGLLVEFSDVMLSQMDLFEDLDEQSAQLLADSINAVFFWHVDEPHLEQVQNAFLSTLIELAFQENKLKPDASILKDDFIEFFEYEGKEICGLYDEYLLPEQEKSKKLVTEFISHMNKKNDNGN